MHKQNFTYTIILQDLSSAPPARIRYNRADRAHYRSLGRKSSLQKAGESKGKQKENVSPATLPEVTTQPELQSESSHVQQSGFDAACIFNLDELAKAIETLSSHSAKCGSGCVLEGDTIPSGLCVVLCGTCTKCNTRFPIQSSKRVATSDGKKRWAVNIAAVLSQVATGSGLTRLNTTLAFLGIPGMQKRMSTTIESMVGDEMKQQLVTAMEVAGKVEREHAIDISYHQGVSAVSVIVDGGWSKRTNKHSYNAKSGVAVTVAVNKNFTFRIRATVVLRCERASKNSVLGAIVERFHSVLTVPFCSVFMVPFRIYGPVKCYTTTRAETMVFSTYTKQRILYLYSQGLSVFGRKGFHAVALV